MPRWFKWMHWAKPHYTVYDPAGNLIDRYRTKRKAFNKAQTLGAGATVTIYRWRRNRKGISYGNYRDYSEWVW